MSERKHWTEQAEEDGREYGRNGTPPEQWPGYDKPAKRAAFNKGFTDANRYRLYEIARLEGRAAVDAGKASIHSTGRVDWVTGTNPYADDRRGLYSQHSGWERGVKQRAGEIESAKPRNRIAKLDNEIANLEWEINAIEAKREKLAEMKAERAECERIMREEHEKWIASLPDTHPFKQRKPEEGAPHASE